MFEKPNLNPDFFAEASIAAFLEEYDIKSLIPEFMEKMAKAGKFGKPVARRVWTVFHEGLYKYTIARERVI